MVVSQGTRAMRLGAKLFLAVSLVTALLFAVGG